MPAPQRSPQGISTAVKGSALYNYPAPDPTRQYQIFDDFDQWINTTGGVADTPWVDTLVGTSTHAVVADEPFGAIILTCAGAENDGVQLQWATENFTITSGKKTWFKTRFKVSDATQSDFVFGMAVLDTTAIAADGDGVTDGIFFQKDDGSTTITFQAQKNATTGQVRDTDVGTCGTAYMTLGFEYDGVSTVKAFMDDAHVGSLDLGTTPSAYFPDTPVTLTMAFLAGSAAAATCTVDYIFGAQER